MTSNRFWQVENAIELATTTLAKIQVLTWLCRLGLSCGRAADGCTWLVQAFSLAGISVDLAKTVPSDRETIAKYLLAPRIAATSDSDRVFIALSIMISVMGPTIYTYVGSPQSTMSSLSSNAFLSTVICRISDGPFFTPQRRYYYKSLLPPLSNTRQMRILLRSWVCW
jgi:hypothetical protein